MVQKDKRKKFAYDHVQRKKECRKVLFTGGKAINLDGLDGWAYYYHDLRIGEKGFSKRQMGGGCAMI